tara:strand:+ start:350 stop:625 length:276 start_codon:yes stop_codon:yes gene_type:complete
MLTACGMMVTGSYTGRESVFMDEITFNIHREIYNDINRFKYGDIVETAEGNVGLVLTEEDCDKQGFIKYQIMVEGKKYIYSALELYPLEKK